ncbi:hypothetical protein [Kocuria rhizophila]|uniref:hypothetical protein n=1 Tax=Kocuria rhizophila TaxID=72000 RepID=UPI0034DB6D92
MDTLAERTGRSRGTYLRMAVRSMLPALEQQHWNEIAADFGLIRIQGVVGV